MSKAKHEYSIGHTQTARADPGVYFRGGVFPSCKVLVSSWQPRAQHGGTCTAARPSWSLGEIAPVRRCWSRFAFCFTCAPTLAVD